jgi:hypothetical protein
MAAGSGQAGSTVATGGRGAGAGGADGGGGAEATGAGGNASGGTSGGNGQAGIGESCAYTDNTSRLNAIADGSCPTGYCLWDSRFLTERYCTIPCAGPGVECPEGYVCTEDLGEPGNHWCVHEEPMPPSDMGVPCDDPFLLSSCMHTAYGEESYCITQYADACAARFCLHDPIADENYCSMPCSSSVPCPDGYDCHPLGGIRGEEHDYCVKHHEPVDYVGLPCYRGSEGCEERPCPTREAEYNCAQEGSGICVMDTRQGRLVTYAEYCSVRCEDVACPASFVCMEITTLGAGSAPSGSYCVSAI